LSTQVAESPLSYCLTTVDACFVHFLKLVLINMTLQTL